MTSRFINHKNVATGTIITRRAKPLTGPRFMLPDSISAACAKAKPNRWHNCTMLRCACPCHERGEA